MVRVAAPADRRRGGGKARRKARRKEFACHTCETGLTKTRRKCSIHYASLAKASFFSYLTRGISGSLYAIRIACDALCQRRWCHF
jgi:hypothetical protein